ncbi:hypothetical protein N7516_002254 [Penicillium verrucosum]|uniref:uncharacterized protein n=1 Tax=Penicillium verrucosum TaxID=60171 RepID=UPI002545A392|nr:uncharacterized protein N7516_002254 [Penicillium verrucosum]KAJ5942086.1 hypothetical protein N7516_002254 [Penicillium verrucosum]
MSSIKHSPRPDARSPRLHLAHPTDQENIEIWKLTSDAWKDCLSVDMYIKEAAYLMTVPLARNGGMSQWILVDKNLPPDQRPLLASCETFRKRSWISDSAGNVIETITHGVASVFTDAKFRGQGYASRLMTELAEKLRTWQTEMTECAASILFSDIGKEFYSNLGWHAFPSHFLEFEPSTEELSAAVPIFTTDLEQLCEIDEVLSRKALCVPSTDAKARLMIVPDYEHMLWHHSKEEFASEILFQRKPHIKGAIFGQDGHRVWVVWTHRYYESPSDTASMNTLYILRLVIENEALLESDLQVEALRAVLLAAQAEAAEWGLHSVKLWGSSTAVQEMIRRTGIEYRYEDRENEGICSLRWYGGGSGLEDEVEWVGNEKYGWC